MSQSVLVETYRDRACVIAFELDNGLSPAGDFDLVLRAETRHHCTGALVSTCSAAPSGKPSKRTFNGVGAPVVVC